MTCALISQYKAENHLKIDVTQNYSVDDLKSAFCTRLSCMKDPRDRSSGANLDKSVQHKSPLSVIQIWFLFISRVLTNHALRIIPTYLQVIRTLLTVEVCTWFGGSSQTSEGPRFLRLSSMSAGASVFSSECNVREGGCGSFVEWIVSLVERHTWTDTKFQQTFVIV